MIKKGDTVQLVLSYSKRDELLIEGVVLNMPRGAGDLLQLKLSDTDETIALNPYHHGFALMKKVEPPQFDIDGNPEISHSKKVNDAKS